MVGGVGRTVHLIVHNDAGFRHHQLGAEEQVDGRGQTDGQPGRVCRHDV